MNYRLESLKYFIDIFTWRYNGHIGVQNNETAAILVYQDNPVEPFSLHIKDCLLLPEINIATDHVSEDDLFRCSPPLGNHVTQCLNPLAACRQGEYCE